MRALTYHGKRDVRVDRVPDPEIREPTDGVVRITSTGLCGSDLHLYEALGAFLDAGDILGTTRRSASCSTSHGDSRQASPTRVPSPFPESPVRARRQAQNAPWCNAVLRPARAQWCRFVPNA